MAFKIVRNDITKIAADAIVNTANPLPGYGSGTDAAVYEAAGKEKLLAERAKIGEIKVGEAKYTPAFGLNAKYIIHTVGPVWQGGNAGEKEAIENCYKNCLSLAEELGCESIAFPLISTGNYGFPKEDALKILISVFSEYLTDHETEITLAVFDGESFAVSGKIFAGIDAYIDEHYVSEKLDEEYSPAEEKSHLNESRYFRERSSVSGAKKRFSLGNRPVFAAKTRAKESACMDDMQIVFEEAEEPAGELPDDSLQAPVPVKKERSLDEVMNQVGETWQQSLFRLIDEKGFSDTEVYKRANVDRKLFSKIRSNEAYQPKKSTAIAFALAMHLNLDETKDFLARAGYALSPGSRADLIVEYFIDNGEYDLFKINIALFDHDQPLLGA